MAEIYPSEVDLISFLPSVNQGKYALWLTSTAHVSGVGREKYGQTGVRTRDHPNLEGGATTAPPSR
jgi:hypothetical protein